MTLDEFMKSQLSALVVLAAEQTAAAINDPDQLCSIPLAFFRIEQSLLAAWERAYNELENR